jgi:uncharacterized protein (TIGR04255 family)
MTSALPSFNKPPVIETVLGIEFAPIEGWGIPTFGLYWSQIRKEYPTYEVQPPLASSVEKFDAPAEPMLPSVQLLTASESRCWFASTDDSSLIQIQHDRFLLNWRKGEADRPYPRYEDFVKPAFKKEWLRFTEFLTQQSFRSPDVVQCEVSYINHIPKGQGWHAADDWKEVFTRSGVTRPPAFLPSPESFRLNANYVMPANRGRLRIAANPAIRLSDQQEVIVLTLTARGRPASSTVADVIKWIDMGHEWVVRGFADFTSEKMHKIWERQR